MNYILRSMLYNLTRKRVNEKKLDITHLYVKKQDISYFNLSTNKILTIKNNGKTQFFRECPELCPKCDFFKNAINEFFESLENLDADFESFDQDLPINMDFSSDDIDNFKAYISEKTNDSFTDKLSYTDIVSESCGFSIWENQVYDAAFLKKFGLDNIPPKTEDISVYFLWCMRSAAITYRTLNIARGKKYSYFSAVRSMASVIVADFLGLSHMIPDARWCVLKIEDNKELFGVLSDEAPGKRMSDFQVIPDGSLQKELMNLQVLDLISYQVDHGPNNYTVGGNSGDYRVCAFDNDNPYTFFPFPYISGSFAGCSSFINKSGEITRPHLDRSLAERILSLDIKELCYKLKPYLNFIQRIALSKRIKRLRKAIKMSDKVNENFLLADSAWNGGTVQNEKNGNGVITYLTRAVESKNKGC